MRKFGRFGDWRREWFDKSDSSCVYGDGYTCIGWRLYGRVYAFDVADDRVERIRQDGRRRPMSMTKVPEGR
jgi:hypothetical protein